MGLVFMIVLGAIIGWLAAIVLESESRAGLLRNLGAGIVGALVAGLLVSPMVGAGSMLADRYTVAALIVAFAGSVILIACANIFRRLQLR